MRRKPGNLSLKDCYVILNIPKDASLEDVKHAYRVRAFELHPDLNPNDPEASKNFQLLNEAYVALSSVLKAQGAPETDSEQAKEQKTKTTEDKRREQADQAYQEQDVLRDLLNDPFARRVFEDIYSELSKKQTAKEPAKEHEPVRPKPNPQPAAQPKAQHKPVTPTSSKGQSIIPPKEQTEKGVGNFFKGWLKHQIDDELTLTIPQASLAPGRRIRLQIRHGISNELKTIEVTIPKDFVRGKPIRLKGLGKHIGPLKGDLYLFLQGV
ncbi:MAG: J domain-containing protein [Desulfovibrio sp.]|nr:J domain-containing protein [Desulfovibrio sp.]